MIGEDPHQTAEWLFKECPECEHAFTIVDKYGVFCGIKDCGWKITGEESELFVKQAMKESAER